MSKSGKRALFIVGTLVAGLVAVAYMVRMSSQPAAGSVLELVLDDDIPDHVEVEGLSRLFGGRKLTLRDDLEALRLARDDGRIKGLLVAIDGPVAGSAKLQELRDAILDFQRGGKWAVAYLETAGEFSPGGQPTGDPQPVQVTHHNTLGTLTPAFLQGPSSAGLGHAGNTDFMSNIDALSAAAQAETFPKST